MESFDFGTLVLIVVLIVSLPLLFWKWRPQFWRDLAKQTHLEYRPDWRFLNPHLAGTYQGFRVIIDNFTDYSKSLREYVRITVTVNNPSRLRFSIADKNFPMMVVDHVTFSQPTELDDKELDRVFHVWGRMDNSVRTILTRPLIRERLLKHRPLHIQLSEKQLQYKKFGLDADIPGVISILSTLIIIARAIDSEPIQNTTQT